MLLALFSALLVMVTQLQYHAFKKFNWHQPSHSTPPPQKKTKKKPHLNFGCGDCYFHVKGDWQGNFLSYTGTCSFSSGCLWLIAYAEAARIWSLIVISSDHLFTSALWSIVWFSGWEYCLFFVLNNALWWFLLDGQMFAFLGKNSVWF